jgi:hypothetical protein
MARQKGSRTGHCQGCNHVERARIERRLAAGASIKGTARKFEIDYHALRRHWINHVSPEARAAYIAGAGATKDRSKQSSRTSLSRWSTITGLRVAGYTAPSAQHAKPVMETCWRCLSVGCMKTFAIVVD